MGETAFDSVVSFFAFEIQEMAVKFGAGAAFGEREDFDEISRDRLNLIVQIQSFGDDRFSVDAVHEEVGRQHEN